MYLSVMCVKKLKNTTYFCATRTLYYLPKLIFYHEDYAFLLIMVLEV